MLTAAGHHLEAEWTEPRTEAVHMAAGGWRTGNEWVGRGAPSMPHGYGQAQWRPAGYLNTLQNVDLPGCSVQVLFFY